MISLQMVEELRAYANISFSEAKEALEETNGDILEAIIRLEERGQVKKPKYDGYYSTRDKSEDGKEDQSENRKGSKSNEEHISSFQETLKKLMVFAKRMFDKGNRNLFQVTRAGDKVMSFPVTILLLLIILTFWFTIPLMILGLFMGYKYEFTGPDLGKESVNRAMDGASNVAENIKNEFKGDGLDH